MKFSEATASGISGGPSARSQRQPPRAAGWFLVLLNVEPRDVTRYRRTRALRAAGYQVIEAASPADAFAAITHHAPSAALIDGNLPASSSTDLCDTLKRLHPDLRVVLISRASTSSEARETSQATLADACVCEPIALDALVTVVDDIMAGITPDDSRAWVISDDSGLILDLSEDAARLHNGSRRGLQQRNLIVCVEVRRDKLAKGFGAGVFGRARHAVGPSSSKGAAPNLDLRRTHQGN